MAEGLYNQIDSINQQLGNIMAEVQVDQTVLDGAASALSNLSTAVESLVAEVDSFLKSPPAQALADGDVAGLTTALSTASQAQTDSAAAQQALATAQNPPAPTPPSPPATAKHEADDSKDK